MIEKYNTNIICNIANEDCKKLNDIVSMVKKIVQLKGDNGKFINSLAGNKFDSIQWYPSTNGSYTINKSVVYLCLRNKKNNNNFYPDYMLLHVALHEFGHVICDENGHTPKYWAIFDSLKELGKMSKLIDCCTDKSVDKNTLSNCCMVDELNGRPLIKGYCPNKEGWVLQENCDWIIILVIFIVFIILSVIAYNVYVNASKNKKI